jgi:phenylpyruvate tautomerase PptA (4-oxalocrotonate tautomerase family)
MPILDVEIIGPIAEASLARRLADAAGEVFGSKPQGTWVKLRTMERVHYAENGGTPDDVSPVLVRVLQYAPPEGDALAEEIGRLTRAIAEACGRATHNVHVLYEPPAAGRIAFGGELRR